MSDLKVIMLSENNQRQTTYYMILFIWNSRKAEGEVIYTDRKQISSHLGFGGWGDPRKQNYKEAQGNLGERDRYVHYLDCGETFYGWYMSKVIKLYTLNMWNYCMPIIVIHPKLYLLEVHAPHPKNLLLLLYIPSHVMATQAFQLLRPNTLKLFSIIFSYFKNKSNVF